MNTISKLHKYIDNGNLNLDKVMDDFTPYLKTVINNYAVIELKEEDIEEILIDTFVVLWKNYSEDIVYLEAYLSGIAKNLTREKVRKYHYTNDISDYENELYYNDNIDYLLEQNQKIKDLKLSYKLLNEIDYKILTLFYYYSKPTREIAKELYLSDFNVRQKLTRIRKKLKKNLGGKFNG